MDQVRFKSGNSGILESTQEYSGMTWGSYGNASGMTWKYLKDSVISQNSTKFNPNLGSLRLLGSPSVSSRTNSDYP